MMTRLEEKLAFLKAHRGIPKAAKNGAGMTEPTREERDALTAAFDEAEDALTRLLTLVGRARMMRMRSNRCTPHRARAAA
jgi:hypothetical protein